jgi:hypothetical protein
MVRLDLAVLLVAAAVAHAVKANTPSIVPGAYIVEYEDDQVGSIALMSYPAILTFV